MPTVKSPVKKITSKKVAPVKVLPKKVTKAAPKTSGLSTPVYSMVGVSSGRLSLPKSIFGAKVNEALITQAMRVYLTNQKPPTGHTKTRGEVEGSTRKIQKQKGTGRARHGGIRAPIFVGGGIAMGPRVRKVMLDLPKKMKKAALISALSLRVSEGAVESLNMEKASGKTSEVAKLIKKLNKKSTLLVGSKEAANIQRAAKNFVGANYKSAKDLNVYDVIAHSNLLISKDAVSELELRMKGKDA